MKRDRAARPGRPHDRPAPPALKQCRSWRSRARAARWVAALGLALLAEASSAQEIGSALPSNARLVVDVTASGDGLRLPVGPASRAGLETVEARGQVRHRVWQIASEALTPGQAMAPLRDILAAQGFAPVLDCDAEACGGFAFRFRTPTRPPPEMFVDLGNFRYLTAARPTSDGQTWAALMVSRSDAFVFVQLTHVHPNAPTVAPPVSEALPADPASAQDVVARLRSEGRAVLTGVRFAPGADQLTGAGAPALAALASFLREAPDTQVLVVGHTDALGSLAANIDLSRRRARAVRAWLIERHGVDADRIGAEGVGYLAPLAPNETPEGREKNRRVEVILDGVP